MSWTKRTGLVLGPTFAGVLALCLAMESGKANAEDQTPATDVAEANARCATRLAISFYGTSPTPAMLASQAPQRELVDVLIDDAAFVERFSRFINASLNRGNGARPEDDAVYYMAKFVLTNKKPWSEMFVGRYSVDLVGDRGVQVLPDPNGLGYFRSKPWLVRYAGNEPAGIKLVTAYRMMQNVVGLQLVASTNAPEADVSAAGRASKACSSCHYDNWHALDKVAGVLSTRVTDAQGKVDFKPYTGAPQMLLDGVSVANDDELIHALVATEDFSVNACRLAFKFLYGREENTCEGETFDRCLDEFQAKKTMQSAIAVLAKNPSYCQ